MGEEPPGRKPFRSDPPTHIFFPGAELLRRNVIENFDG